MSAEDAYENDMLPNTAAPSRRRKRTWHRIVPLLSVLVLLLGITVVALAVPYSQKERKLQELKGKIKKLDNVTSAARKESARYLLDLLSTGWKFHEWSLYYFSQVQKTWQEAEDFCASYGAHLTSVTSQEEMEYLYREANGTMFWIGLKDQTKGQNEKRHWIWTDGTKYSKQVSFWGEGEPNNWSGHHEDCVQIRFPNIKAWNDDDCTSRFNWICKKVFWAKGESGPRTI